MYAKISGNRIMMFNNKFIIFFLSGILLFQLPIVNLQNKNKKDSDNSLKIISYNIWNGFNWTKDECRRKQVSRWIVEQTPDVVALQELCGYSEKKLKENAKNWNHPYVALLKNDGYPVGLTSREPILVKKKILNNLHHGALHCETFGIDFLVVHLHPGSYAFRRNEAQIILQYLENIREKTNRYIVLGDFNSHSPFDADLYEDDGYLLQRLRESNAAKPLSGNLVNGHLDFAVQSAFLAFPLVDVCQTFTTGLEQRGSFPGLILGEVNGESNQQLKERLERIDYILVSPEMAKKCLKAQVQNGEDTAFLSDHYPVAAEFIK